MADKGEHVRVTVKDTGAHITITRELYDTNPDPYTELKEDPYGADGLPAPAAQPETSAKKATTSTADSSKENS